MLLDTSLDVRVFGFAALAAIVATLLFALVPAIQATSRNLIDRIKDGQHATQTQERRRILPRVLLGMEVGLALMLVVGAGLLASSLVRLYTSGEGFDPHGVQNISFDMDKLGLKDEALIAFYREMGDRLQHQPGVKSVSFARIVPLSRFPMGRELLRSGRRRPRHLFELRRAGLFRHHAHSSVRRARLYME